MTLNLDMQSEANDSLKKSAINSFQNNYQKTWKHDPKIL